MELVFSQYLSLPCMLIVVWNTGVSCDGNIRNIHVKTAGACNLAHVSQQTFTESLMDCTVACLARQESGSCAAYQWNTATGLCQMQDTLNVTDSSEAADSASVMYDTDSGIACVDENACPDGHVCEDPGCTGLRRCLRVSDCADILSAKPDSPSGPYDILLAGTQQVVQVWCDMDTDGGGWTVFLKRLDGSVDFYRDLAAYQRGFGDVKGEHWLGLDTLHAMMSSNAYELRADISDWAGASAYSHYASVQVADEADGYRLTLGAFLSGDGGNGLNTLNNMQFSARDIDRDAASNHHCAEKKHGAFWYKSCCKCNPTGKYYTGGANSGGIQDNGMFWNTWSVYHDPYYSMNTLDMKLRP